MRTLFKALAVVSIVSNGLGVNAGSGDDISEMDYKFIEEASMDFPASKHELNNWDTFGAAMMFKDHVVIVPEVPERRGAVHNNIKLSPEDGDAWALDIELDIGNEQKTEKGGNGVGIYYLIDGNLEDMNQGVFGFGKRFHGFAIYINNILQGENGQNYIVGAHNDGSQLVNPMKLTGSLEDMPSERNYCRVQTRNRPANKPLYLRITHDYNDIRIKVEVADNLVDVGPDGNLDDLFWQHGADGDVDFKPCFDLKVSLAEGDHGQWLLSSATALTNPDHVYVSKFWLHDLNQRISEDSDYNELIHEKHQTSSRKAFDTAELRDHKDSVADLIHTDNKDSFVKLSEETLYDFLPTQMLNTRKKFHEGYVAASHLLNFYSSITVPMHEHESFDEQSFLADEIFANLTNLQQEMDGAPDALLELEETYHLASKHSIEESDKKHTMTDREKDQQFDEQVDEFMSKSDLMQKKIGVLKRKCEEMTQMTSRLHGTMDKIEALFVKDIEQRKKSVESAGDKLDASMKRAGTLDLSEVDAIFDELESAEANSFIGALFMNGVNILMLATIATAAFVMHKMNESTGKRF